MDNSPTYAPSASLPSPRTDPIPSALFENYDEDLKSLLGGVNGKLADVRGLKGGA